MAPLKNLTPAVLKGMVDKQVLAENTRLHKVFSTHLQSMVKDGVFFPAPDGSLISEGAATLAVKSASIAKLAGTEFIAVSSDGHAYGFIKLGKPKQIDVKQFEALTPDHRITKAEREMLYPEAEKLYAYKILGFERFADPLQVTLPKPPSDIIENVEFKNVDALDNVPINDVSKTNIVNSYFLVATEMDLRGLGRTTTTPLDKALAKSLRKTIQKQNPFLIVQPEGESFPFVVQHHARGVWGKKERVEFSNQLKAVQKLPVTKRKKALAKSFMDFDAEYFTGTIADIQNAIKNDKGVDAITSKFLKKEPPTASVEKARIVNRGSLHTDLRIETPGNQLIGWTLNSPIAVIQKLDGTLIALSDDKFLRHKEGVNVLTQKKAAHAPAWLTMVTSGEPVKEIPPGEDGASKDAYGLIIFKDKGSLVYGVQKSDFHEYFLWFDKNKSLNGRWGFQLSSGGEGQSPAWLLNKPLDSAQEVKKAKVIPILKRDDEEKTVTGVVLQPEVIDAQNEIYSAEVIKDTMYGFNSRINNGSRIGLMHEELNHPFIVLQSYIAPVDFTLNGKAVIKGSWVMTVKVLDDIIWAAVKAGELNGFSIHGIATAVKEPVKEERVAA